MREKHFTRHNEVLWLWEWEGNRTSNDITEHMANMETEHWGCSSPLERSASVFSAKNIFCHLTHNRGLLSIFHTLPHSYPATFSFQEFHSTKSYPIPCLSQSNPKLVNLKIVQLFPFTIWLKFTSTVCTFTQQPDSRIDLWKLSLHNSLQMKH